MNWRGLKIRDEASRVVSEAQSAVFLISEKFLQSFANRLRRFPV
jgi:hypothetical protein